MTTFEKIQASRVEIQAARALIKDMKQHRVPPFRLENAVDALDAVASELLLCHAETISVEWLAQAMHRSLCE